MFAPFKGICHTCGYDHDDFVDLFGGSQSAWAVWTKDDGIIYTAPDETMCNDHINSCLMDDELREYGKTMHLVEIFYQEPK